MFPPFNLVVGELHEESGVTDTDVDHTIVADGRGSVGLAWSESLLSVLSVTVTVTNYRDNRGRVGTTRVGGRVPR